MKTSLMPFAKFVGASPQTKIALVTGGKHPTTYEPAHDYWKGPREQIPKIHQSGGSKADLDKFIQTITSNRASNYKERVEAYKRWWGNNKIVWLGGNPEVWKSGSLEVRVSP